MKRRTKIGAGAVAGVALAAAFLITQQDPEPLEMFYYEGATVLNYDVPPRMYALVHRAPRSRQDTPECKPAAFNFPCTVYRESEGVKLHVFRCMDLRGPAKFDQESCKNQREYNESFEVTR